MTDFPETPWDDAPHGVRIWDPSVARRLAAGGAVGGALGGGLAGAVASGALPIAYLGSLGASGTAPAAVAGAGVGIALGGLIGGVVGLQRLPAAPAAGAHPEPRRASVLVDGLVAGLIGAVAYWLLDHAIAWSAHGRPLEPSGYMASVILGRDALGLGHRAPGAAVAWGWVGHLVASLPWGFALAALARWRPRWLASVEAVAPVALLYGVAVWIANVYVVAPILGMPWFKEHDPMTMLLVHLAFGAGAAAWIHARTRASDVRSSART